MYQSVLLRRLPLLLSLVVILLSSCNYIRLISEYDEITDRAVTALQQKVSRFFVQVEREVGTGKARYENHTQFYEEVRVDLNTLRIRADAIDKNQIVQDQIAELTKMTDNLEKLHKIGFATADQIQVLEQPFNAAFTAIIKLQLGLKRGEKNKRQS